MYEEAQAALRWQQQEQERAQQDRPQVRPVRAQGELAAMADSMRQAEEVHNAGPRVLEGAQSAAAAFCVLRSEFWEEGRRGVCLLSSAMLVNP